MGADSVGVADAAVARQVLGDDAEVTEITTAPPSSTPTVVAPTTVPAATAPTAPPSEAAVETRHPRVRGLGFRALIGRHKFFSVIFTIGVALRIITMIGYQPAMWFNDSFDYLHAALRFYPHPIRPDGYSFLLLIFYPLHSFALVVGVQHLMGAAMGLMVYALLRTRFRLPGWGATLCAAPVLLDAYQIQLEQLILSDVLFEFLAVAAITIMLWWARPSWKAAAAAGLLIGLAGITRSLGPAVLVATLVYLVVRRTNWRVIAASVVFCAVPMGAYSAWYYSVHGKFAETGTSGIFLYARVSAFADCNKIKDLPVSEIPLCYMKPPRYPQDAIWDQKSRLLRNSPNKFSDYQNQLTSDFSKRAIMAQPGDYLRVMAIDFFRSFQWNRTVYPDRNTFNLYQFRSASSGLPGWRMPGGGTASGDAHQYERGDASTKVVEPFGVTMRYYQRYVYMRGTMVGVLLLIGLAGMVPMWRRFGGRALLPWITSVGLLLAPAATAEFDYRYVLPAVPIAAIAAGLAFTAESRTASARFFRRRKDAPEPVEAAEASA